MTYNDDFIPIDDAQDLEGPSYPVAFGVELTPKIQGILIGVLGVGLAFFAFTRLVQPVQQTKLEIEQRVADKRSIRDNQADRIEEVNAVRAELDNALSRREGIYSLLGEPDSLDTLLLDINQQVKSSNASIDQAIARDFDNLGAPAELAAFGLTSQQIERLRREFSENPIRQRLFYASELWQFTPDGLSGVIRDDVYGPELNGRLERQRVNVSIRSLFAQAQTIIRNLERLEPLIIINDFNQKWAELDGVESEDVIGITRPLDTIFTLEVLVPVGDPLEPPDVSAPQETTEGEGEGEGAGDDTTNEE